MTTTITEKYLEALKAIGDWVIVSDWAKKVGELYPEILEKAENEAASYATESTGLREIAARISSAIVRGSYLDNIEIDSSERPRRVRYISKIDHEEHIQQEIEEDVAPLKRDEIIRLALNQASDYEKYRLTEFDSISKQLKQFFGLSFEVDHAHALLNTDSHGVHHPDNLQLLLKAHNGQKNNSNWVRFTLDEQIEYIEAAIKLQQIVAPKLIIKMEMEVLDSLLDRLKRIYQV